MKLQLPPAVFGRLHLFWPAAAMALLVVAASPGPSLADQPRPGGQLVTVSATNNAKITMTFSGGPIALDPESAKAIFPPQSVDVFPGPGNGEPTYYVGKGGGNGFTVTVNSNRPWTGFVAASQEPGVPPEMSVSSGALRYSLRVLRSYGDSSAAPVLTTSLNPWVVDNAKGSTDFHFYYVLRVGPGQSPSGFYSTVYFTAVQS